MFSDSIANLALLVIHLGFAALLGAFTRHANSPTNRIAFFAAALAYFGSSLNLPLDPLPKLAVWLASIAIFAFFARALPGAAWQARLAWLYAGFAMLLIMVWSAAQGWVSPVISLGAAAAWAGVMAWRRGLDARA